MLFTVISASLSVLPINPWLPSQCLCRLQRAGGEHLFLLQTLIEKEWLSFGHKFSDRCGHTSTSDNKEQSPVFLQVRLAAYR